MGDTGSAGSGPGGGGSTGPGRLKRFGRAFIDLLETAMTSPSGDPTPMPVPTPGPKRA